ncbi:hypothetical protein ALC56_07603, partial [Trachymyrmex septentrionalis]
IRTLRLRRFHRKGSVNLESSSSQLSSKLSLANGKFIFHRNTNPSPKTNHYPGRVAISITLWDDECVPLCETWSCNSTRTRRKGAPDESSLAWLPPLAYRFTDVFRNFVPFSQVVRETLDVSTDGQTKPEVDRLMGMQVVRVKNTLPRNIHKTAASETGARKTLDPDKWRQDGMRFLGDNMFSRAAVQLNRDDQLCEFRKVFEKATACWNPAFRAASHFGQKEASFGSGKGEFYHGEYRAELFRQHDSRQTSMDLFCRFLYNVVIAVVVFLRMIKNGLLSFENPNYHLDPARLDDALNSNGNGSSLYDELYQELVGGGGRSGEVTGGGGGGGTRVQARRTYATLDLGSMGVDVTQGPLTQDSVTDDAPDNTDNHNLG